MNARRIPALVKVAAVLVLMPGAGLGEEAESGAGERKGGFKPSRLIGKLIPGGKSEAAKPGDIAPSASQPAPPPVTRDGSAAAPAARAEPMGAGGEKKQDRGILSGVTGAVGKFLPDGSRKEARKEAAAADPPKERSGLLDRIRQGLEGGYEPPPPAPVTVATPVEPPPPTQRGRGSDPSDRSGPKPKQVLTIPVAPRPPVAPAPTRAEMPRAAETPPVQGADAKPEPAGVGLPDPKPDPAALPSASAAPPMTPMTASRAAGDAPEAAVGGAHFVTIRDGVEAKVATPEGGEGVLKAGTVLRFDGKSDTHVRARLANGKGIELELWQVRDATFEEAVKFLQSSD